MSDLVETAAELRRHELLADVAENVAKRLMEKHAVELERAADIGNHLADFLSEHWNGQNIYMVSDAAYKLSKRDLEIYRLMERGNAQELAAKFSLSYVRIYQIYRRVLAQMRARSQHDLFAQAGGLEAGQKVQGAEPGAAVVQNQAATTCPQAD